MLNEISTALTKKLVPNAEEDDKEVYEYGFMLLLSTFSAFVSTAVISIIADSIQSWLAYLLYFFLMRLFTGGFHAKTFKSCFITTNCIYVVIVFSSKITEALVDQYSHITIVIQSLLIIGFLITIIFSPMDSPNHPSSEEKLRKFKGIVIILSCLSIISIVLYDHYLTKMFIPAVFAYCWTSLLIIIEKIKRRRLKNGRSKNSFGESD